MVKEGAAAKKPAASAKVAVGVAAVASEASVVAAAAVPVVEPVVIKATPELAPPTPKIPTAKPEESRPLPSIVNPPKSRHKPKKSSDTAANDDEPKADAARVSLSPTQSSKVLEPPKHVEIEAEAETEAPKPLATVVEAPSVPAAKKSLAPKRPEPEEEAAKSVASYTEAALPTGSHNPATKANRRPVSEEDFEDIKPHPVKFSLKLALGVGLPLGLAAGAAVWLKVDRDIALYTLLVLLSLFATAALLSQAALMYGLSRNQDGRPTHRARWWAAARSGFIEVINVDLATIILGLLTLAAWFGLWQTYAGIPGPQPVQWGVLGLGNLALAWVMLGLLSARHIAIPAVIIGGVTSNAGLKLGWQTYVKAGGHLILALLETLAARLSMLLALTTFLLLAAREVPVWDDVTFAIGTGLAVAVLAVGLLSLMLHLEVRVWLKQYRFWINLFHPEQKLRLLSGRMHGSIKR
jgi:hypothetical protein